VAPLLLRLERTAEVLDCSPTTVKRLIKAGDLPAVKVNGATRIRVADLRAAAASGDMDRVLELRRRADDLPTLIDGAALAEAGARVAYLEAVIADVQSQRPHLSAAWAQAKDRLEAAQRAFTQADDAVRAATNTVTDFNQRLGYARRAYQDLLAGPGDAGPVVRSRIHALKANRR